MPTVASTDVPTALPTRVLPPGGLSGAQNLLHLYDSALADPFWDRGRFKQENGSWRLGRLDTTDGDTHFLSPPADLLESSYGNQAARRIASLQAEIALLSASADEVYFGIALQNATGDIKVGIQIQQIGPAVISLALYQNGVADVISQRSVNNLIARLRLDHDRDKATVSAYFNDSPVGSAMTFDAADQAVLPAIFVKDGGVVIGVSAWDLRLE